jgi:hypothetical protein
MSIKTVYGITAAGLTAGFIALKVGMHLYEASLFETQNRIHIHTNPGAILYQRHHARPH